MYPEETDDCKTLTKVTYEENCAIEFAASNKMTQNCRIKFNVKKGNETYVQQIKPTYQQIDIS